MRDSSKMSLLDGLLCVCVFALMGCGVLFICQKWHYAWDGTKWLAGRLTMCNCPAQHSVVWGKGMSLSKYDSLFGGVQDCYPDPPYESDDGITFRDGSGIITFEPNAQ